MFFSFWGRAQTGDHRENIHQRSKPKQISLLKNTSQIKLFGLKIENTMKYFLKVTICKFKNCMFWGGLVS